MHNGFKIYVAGKAAEAHPKEAISYDQNIY